MAKTVKDYVDLPYTFEVRPEAEGGWFVHVKELPGCMSRGETAEEALANIREVLPLWLEAAIEDGYAIPEPRTAEEYSGKFVARVPRSLHRELVEKAEQEGVSLNQYVSSTLARSVGQASVYMPKIEDNPTWPGLKDSLWRVLIAAGVHQEAAQVDERLFADWTNQQLDQVVAALEGGYERDAISYLTGVDDALRVGEKRSPLLGCLRRVVQLITEQVTDLHQLQQSMFVDIQRIRARVNQAARTSNSDYLSRIAADERMSYLRQASTLEEETGGWQTEDVPFPRRRE
jgi:antitoxin HicB